MTHENKITDHLDFIIITTLLGKNNTAANTNVIFDLLMLVVHHQ